MRFPVILGLKDFKQSLKPLRLSVMGFEMNSHLEAMISCTSSCLLHCGLDPLHENIFFWSTVSETSRTCDFKDTDFVVNTMQNKWHMKKGILHRTWLLSPQSFKIGGEIVGFGYSFEPYSLQYIVSLGRSNLLLPQLRCSTKERGCGDLNQHKMSTLMCWVCTTAPEASVVSL